MSALDPQTAHSEVVMTRSDMTEAVRRLAQGIIDDNDDVDHVVLLGILTRGRPLADRLADQIAALTSIRPRVGSLATTLYRDDLRSGKTAAKLGPGETHFDFDVNGVTVVLVDDVLASGRTVRAALDEVMDYGRPVRVRLACLIDRGLRELPIQADYLGLSLVTSQDDHVSVRMVEVDGDDEVVVNRGSRDG